MKLKNEQLQIAPSPEFHTDIKKGNIPAVIEYLLKNVNPAYSMVNETDSEGMTALMLSIVKNQWDIFNILIRFPNINFVAKDNKGSNALHWAARFGLNAYVKILIAFGIPIDEENLDKASAQDLAIIHGFTYTAELIRYQKKLKQSYSCSRSLKQWMTFISTFGNYKLLNIEEIVPINTPVEPAKTFPSELKKQHPAANQNGAATPPPQMFFSTTATDKLISSRSDELFMFAENPVWAYPSYFHPNKRENQSQGEEIAENLTQSK